MTSPLFESSDVDSSRFVWDSAVHDWHGERCAFYLLRLPRIDATSVRKIENIASRIGLVSTSVYVLYGYFDILIRTWANAEERERLAEALDEHLPGVEVELFNVADVDYSRWSGVRGLASPTTIHANQRNIECVVSSERSAPEVANAIVQLERDGLLHRYSPHRTDALRYKIYLILRRQRVDDPELTAGRRTRLESILGDLAFLRLPSVYFGSGRTIDCVVKGVVDANDIGGLYAHVLHLKAQLEEADLSLRPMTMILAKAGETDRDHLRLDQVGPDSRAVRYLKVSISESITAKWSEIPEQKRVLVVKMFDEVWGDIAETPFNKYFLDLLEGHLADDYYKINGSLQFLFQLEDELRTTVISRLLPTLLGPKEWRNKVLTFLGTEEDRFAALEDDEGDDLADEARRERLRVSRLRETVKERTDSMGLGEALHLVRRLVSADVLDKADVESHLGPGWFERYLPASELRNEYVHGRLNSFNPLTDDEWTALMGRVVPAGRLVGLLQS